MKKLFFAAFLLLALVQLAPGQPSDTFINNGTITFPPQVDAINFINNGTINIALNSFSALTISGLNTAFLNSTIAPFDFSDVLYFTNRGTMMCDTGFTFDTAPSGEGQRQAAASFGNGNQGFISAGSITNSFTSAFLFFLGAGSGLSGGLPQINIAATNVVNTGELNVGVTGLINVGGDHLDLSRGTLKIEGFDDYAANNLFSPPTNINLTNFGFFAASSVNLGIFETYEGIGLQTNEFDILNNFLLPDPSSPISLVTNLAGLTTIQFVSPPNAAVYVWKAQPDNSNTIFQVVFVNTNLPGISTDVRFELAGGGFTIPVIQWEAIVTNNVGLPTVTNFLYLSDEFGAFQTNFLVIDSFSLTQIPILSPFNYTFNRSFPGYSALAKPNFFPYDALSIFANSLPTTNAYSSMQVNVQPVSSAPDSTALLASQTNLPGRIHIAATNWLDLTHSKITGPNYLNLEATNHFAGSANAQIVAPFMDINIGSTNGMLTVSNLVAPNVPRFSGLIDMWSGRWTNIVTTGTNTMTNTYHVLIVNSGLSPVSPVSVYNFTARATNVVISDALNIASSLLLQAQNLTITSNDASAAVPTGEITLTNADIFWSSSLPILQNLTNWGTINLANTAYFLGSRQSPYYTTNFDEAYLSFVNHGSIFTSGDVIWADYVENSGFGLTFFQFGGFTFTNTTGALIESIAGPITLRANDALLENGTILTAAGDIGINAGNLTITNHSLQASGSLTLSVSNALVDGGIASGNFWSAGDGINLLVKPVTGDFLGTTVTLSAPAGLEVDDIWAGMDLSNSVAGFTNNGALGHLILDGGDTFSQFFFGGPDSQNPYAIYVDQLELQDGATNRATENGSETFTAFDIAPNFTIYFADAIIAQNDISEKLNGSAGGRLVWVPAYAGIFSGTNFVYPSGNTYRFNRALVTSPDIDSNGNGSANAYDPAPIYTADSVNLSVTTTNLPALAPVVSWATLARTTNYLYYKADSAGTNWMMVTNFVQGPQSGTVSVIDRGRTNSTGYYRVKVNGPLPY